MGEEEFLFPMVQKTNDTFLYKELKYDRRIQLKQVHLFYIRFGILKIAALAMKLPTKF